MLYNWDNKADTVTWGDFEGTGIQTHDLPTKVNIIRWGTQPSVVNKIFNLGTTNTQSIDLALKMQSCDIISPMHCLTSMKIAAEL